ncbi:TPA: hypothetical protein ACIVK9_002430 [Salmonella enterica subsp. enterica serovar Muenchen]
MDLSRQLTKRLPRLARRIALTRSRPYRKNDQAWIEQKNGSVVRKLAGYGRLDGEPAVKAMNQM